MDNTNEDSITNLNNQTPKDDEIDLSEFWNGILRKKIPNDAEWKKANIKYQIFDSPTMSGDFETRHQYHDESQVSVWTQFDLR